MVKKVIPAIGIVLTLSSCTAFKSLNFTSNRPVSNAPAPVSQTKFIDEISVTPQPVTEPVQQNAEQKATFTTRGLNVEEAPPAKPTMSEVDAILASRSVSKVETASSVQLKYAILMNTEVENLPNKSLLENVDDWYGVRYRTGGNTKSGVDCSGFTVAVYAAVYGFALPRVSREQYRISRKISTTELQEGDLVFFNTNGRGVSHVGVYLGNNKFIHASVSRGVMVSGLFEPYYIKRYIGAGRIEEKQLLAAE
ncbi:MAG: NlpC/P60 family protein [Chitinophagaceae bacterium]